MSDIEKIIAEDVRQEHAGRHMQDWQRIRIAMDRLVDLFEVDMTIEQAKRMAEALWQRLDDSPPPPTKMKSPDGRDMLHREITYVGHALQLVCDGKCDKAWGTSERAEAHNMNGEYVVLSATQFDDVYESPGFDEDDYCYLADDEVGDAPTNPGTYEGDVGKPKTDEQKLNKWCCRACERSDMFEPDEVLELRDLSMRFYNCAPHVRD